MCTPNLRHLFEISILSFIQIKKIPSYFMQNKGRKWLLNARLNGTLFRFLNFFHIFRTVEVHISIGPVMN